MCDYLLVRFVFFAFIAAVLFGTTGTAQALGPEGFSSLSVGTARITIGGAGLALVAFVMWLRNRSALWKPEQRSLQPRTGRTIWVVIIGAAALIAYQPAFFLGTAMNGVAVGTVIAIGSGPIFTGLFEWLLNRRFPGLIWLAATVIAVAGIWLLSGIGEAGGANSTGILLSLTAGVCYAFYALSAKQLLVDGWSPVGSVALIFGAAAIGAVPILLSTDFSWMATASGAVMALWLGIATITIACLFLAYGLKVLAASTVATLGLAEPLTASLLGVFLLHEVLDARSIFGIVLVAIGLVLIGSVRARRRPAPPDPDAPAAPSSQADLTLPASQQPGA